MEKTSDKIRKLRISENLTQQQLADQLHVTKQAISKWENGKSIPDITSVELIAAFFGVSSDYLISDSIEEVKPEVTVTSPNLSKRMNKLTVVLASALAVMLAAVIALSVALGVFVNDSKRDKPVEVNGLVFTYLSDNTEVDLHVINITIIVYNPSDYTKNVMKGSFTEGHRELYIGTVSENYYVADKYPIAAHGEIKISIELASHIGLISRVMKRSLTIKYAGQPIAMVRW